MKCFKTRWLPLPLFVRYRSKESCFWSTRLVYNVSSVTFVRWTCGHFFNPLKSFPVTHIQRKFFWVDLTFDKTAAKIHLEKIFVFGGSSTVLDQGFCAFMSFRPQMGSAGFSAYPKFSVLFVWTARAVDNHVETINFNSGWLVLNCRFGHCMREQLLPSSSGDFGKWVFIKLVSKTVPEVNLFAIRSFSLDVYLHPIKKFN